MKAALSLALLLAAGCDDPAVEAKVAAVLEHGSIAARAVCDCTTTPELGFNSQIVKVRALKLVDGACYVQGNLWGRDEAQAQTCDTDPGNGGNVYIENGLLKQEGGSPLQLVGSADITTCCTGFNLEAFGAEP